MRRRRSWIAVVAAVVVVSAAIGSAAAAPDAVGAKSHPADAAAGSWSGLVARLSRAVLAAPGGRGAAAPQAERQAPRRVSGESGCGIDPHGQPCKPKG